MAVKIVGSRRNGTNAKIFAGITIGVLAIGAVLGVLYFFKVRNDYEKKLSECTTQLNNIKNELAQSKRTGYVPKLGLKYNTKLDESMLEEVEFLSSLPQDMYMDKEDLGKVLNFSVKAEVPILKYMLNEDKIADDLRNAEFNTFTLQTNIEKNDFVDVRIRFPNGEDYIVLSKKMVNDIKLSTGTIWLNMSQKELMTISSATVDAYLRKGTKLYVVKYVQPQTQKDATPTYPFNIDVQSAMMSDPNILEKATIAMTAQARAGLEARMNMIPKENLTSVGSGVDDETKGLQKNIEAIQKEQTNSAKANEQSKNSSQTKSQSSTTSSPSTVKSGTAVIDDSSGGSVLDQVVN